MVANIALVLQMVVNGCVMKSANFSKVEKLIIFLHGSSGRGEDFRGVCDAFFAPKIDNAFFLMPHGVEKISDNTWGWWREIKNDSVEKRAGLDGIRETVCGYIRQMVAEYDCADVNLVGFSQGVRVAFEMMYLSKISKIVAYCGGFSRPSGNPPFVSKPEVLQIHSDDDPVVKYADAVQARKDLRKFGVPAELVTHHNVGHGVSEEGWKIGTAFLSGERKLKKPGLLRRLFCRKAKSGGANILTLSSKNKEERRNVVP